MIHPANATESDIQYGDHRRQGAEAHRHVLHRQPSANLLESARQAALSCRRQGIQDDGAVSDPESVPGVRQADEARRRRERP
jgi:hypothetical protein